jgi:hypothetical protein
MTLGDKNFKQNETKKNFNRALNLDQIRAHETVKIVE